MSQYVKIPRGGYPNVLNDEILKKAICLIGRREKANFVTAKLSDYARGKIYLRQRYGISGCTLKKMHKLKISVNGFEELDDRFSNYISLHIGKTKVVFMAIQDYIVKEPEIIEEFLSISQSFFTNNPDINHTYANSLFYETFRWIHRFETNTESFDQFNKRGGAWEDANGIKEYIKKIDENL